MTSLPAMDATQAQAQTFAHFLAFVAAIFVGNVVLGVLGFFLDNGLLFLWPQYVLPHGVLMGGELRPFLAHGWATVLAGGFWSLVAFVFACLVRRRRLRVTLWLAYPLVIVITCLAWAGLHSLGIRVFLEGP